jgi:hypothetical protein
MRLIFLALCGVGFTSPAFSQTHVTGLVTIIRTGWQSDAFGVVINEPMVNPAGCPTPDGYVSEGSQPGYRTFYAAALAAYATKQKVMVVVHNTECTGPRPKIIGINLPRD